MNVPCKVSIVNEEGLVVLDTLIRPSFNGQNIEKIDEIKPFLRSLTDIHGIKQSWLEDAPTIEQVRDHIFELCGKKAPKPFKLDEPDEPEKTESVLGEITNLKSPKKSESAKINQKTDGIETEPSRWVHNSSEKSKEEAELN